MDNLVGAITKSENLQFKELLRCGSSLIGFVDGSWKGDSNGNIAGMGGLIFKNSGDAIFSFSGPTQAACPFEAEWNAFIFLVNEFARSAWVRCELTILTDCSKIYCKFLEITSTSQDMMSSNSVLNLNNIKVKPIASELNSKADNLAKKGAKSKKINSFWVTGKR